MVLSFSWLSALTVHKEHRELSLYEALTTNGIHPVLLARLLPRLCFGRRGGTGGGEGMLHADVWEPSKTELYSILDPKSDGSK